MFGKFYGIGVGPGDPELLTIKAVNTLHTVDIIAVPESNKEKSSTALEIVKPHLKEGYQTISVFFPMIKSEEERQKSRQKNADIISDLIKEGKNVAFITLGDPMLYSTYIYLIQLMNKAEIEIETIPGIYSFSAISSRLNIPLVKGDEKLAVITSMETTDWVALSNFDTIVCMKIISYKQALSDFLRYHPQYSFVMASNVGHPTETVSYDEAEIETDLPYFTTAILQNTNL